MLFACNKEEGLFPSEKEEEGPSRGKVKPVGEMSELSTTVRRCTSDFLEKSLYQVRQPSERT